MASKPKAQPANTTSHGSWPAIIEAVGKAGAFGALTLLALVLEAALALWFSKADSGAERITAGSLMVVVMLALVGAVAWIEYLRRPAAPPPVQQAVATLDTAGVSRQDIERVAQATTGELTEPEIPAPDASYVIGRPPPGWTIQATTMEELADKFVGTTNASALTLSAVSSVLVMDFGTPLAWTPQPDRMRLNGRRYPVLIADPFGRKLQIMSLRRRQPPFYIERSLYDTVFTQLATIVQSGIVSITSMTSGKLPKTNRDMIVVEAVQEVENVATGDREVDLIRIRIGATAIRGDLFDYLLISSNFQVGRGEDAVAAQVDGDITKLFASFRLLSVPDPAAEARKDSLIADRDFDKFVATKGPALFRQQFSIALGRLADMQLSTAAGITQAAVLLKPFAVYATRFPDPELDLSELWTALDQAERGDTQPLRDTLLANLEQPPATAELSSI